MFTSTDSKATYSHTREYSVGFPGPEALCAELLTDHSHLAFTRSRKNVDHDNIELSNNSRSFELNRHFPTPAILPCFLASLSKNFLNQWRKSKLSWNFSFTNRSTSTLWIIILRKSPTYYQSPCQRPAFGRWSKLF